MGSVFLLVGIFWLGLGVSGAEPYSDEWIFLLWGSIMIGAAHSFTVYNKKGDKK